jgi:GR25 family glycosyltransferase involved in LPS biosynthesis
MDLLQHALYINLDHRIDRNEHVQQELSKIGIANIAERFPAIHMKAGNVGCTLSHIRCLDIAKSNGWPQVFICEDDITFTNPALFMKNLVRFSESQMDWDLIVVGGNNCPPFDVITDAYARVYNIQTTTGYIVQKHYYDILLDNFKEGLSKLLREPDKKKQYSLDIYWKSLQRQGLWYMITPPTVIQYYDYSDIEEKVVDYGAAMLDLEKKELMERLMKEYLEQEKQKRESMKKKILFTNR